MTPAVIVILSLTFLTGIVANPMAEKKFHSKLAEQLEKFPNSLNDVVVSFREEDSDKDKQVASGRAFLSSKSAYNNEVASMKTHMAAAQSNAAALLNQAKARRSSGTPPFKSMNSYWTSNQMFVNQASKEIITALALDPKVTRISLQRATMLRPIRNMSSAVLQTHSQPSLEWHLEAMNIKQAWDLLGHKGTGVRIGIIDTGVRVTHETLKGNYLGKYGWFDPTNTSPTQDDKPRDLEGHGTSVASLAVGAAGAGQLLGGVASDAKWMACIGCESTRCPSETIAACLDFMACPTLPDKTKAKCGEHPHIINFSIGQDPGYDQDEYVGLKKLKQLGIIIVAAAGNQGPGCNTGNYPAELPYIISVGGVQQSTTRGKYEFLYFSSVGPSFQGDSVIKPDITAPGVDLNCADSKGDALYRTLGGTSFSAPLAAGVVALLISKKPGLTSEQVLAVLAKTAETNIDNFNSCCKHYDKRSIPNNFIGHGLINAHKALQAL